MHQVPRARKTIIRSEVSQTKASAQFLPRPLDIGFMDGRPLDRIRLLVRRHFQALGAPADARIGEAILVAEDYFSGYRFEVDDLKAYWLAQTNQVVIFQAGEKMQTIDLGDEDTSTRAA